MNKLESVTIVKHSNHFKLIIVAVSCFFSPSIIAGCLTQATSDYEKVYCEIVHQGGGGSLPAFEDFKRNDLVIQRLLLKRPAAKLKLELPKLDLAKPVSKVGRREQRSKSTVSMPGRAQTVISDSIDVDSKGTDGLSSCTLNRDHVSCGNHQFQLRTNSSNRALEKGVLLTGNRMNIPEYNGDTRNNMEVQYYLTDAYGVYIKKMLEIGLGASTMSYSRFYHTFHDLQAKAVSFTERFETMYSYLKKDKSSMAVSPLLSKHRPSNISACDRVGHRVVVCESDGFNWVYVR